MAGERDLQTLLLSLAPEASPDDYVFCSFAGARYGEHADLDPVASVREAEGLSLVVPAHRAEAHGLPIDSVYRRITLTVHSSLDAVGLTAAVATLLAARGVSANVVAGRFHDHIFVPTQSLEEAMRALHDPDAFLTLGDGRVTE